MMVIMLILTIKMMMDDDDDVQLLFTIGFQLKGEFGSNGQDLLMAAVVSLQDPSSEVRMAGMKLLGAVISSPSAEDLLTVPASLVQVWPFILVLVFSPLIMTMLIIFAIRVRTPGEECASCDHAERPTSRSSSARPTTSSCLRRVEILFRNVIPKFVVVWRMFRKSQYCRQRKWNEKQHV